MRKKNVLAAILILIALLGVFFSPLGRIGYNTNDPAYTRCLAEQENVLSPPTPRIACEASYGPIYGSFLLFINQVVLAGLAIVGCVILLYSLIKRLTRQNL